MAKGYRLTASTGIHKGDREYQQDQIALISHPRVNGCILGVVADGMGGRSGGRKASDQVMLTAKQLFERYSPETDDAPSMLKQMVQEAHIVIKLTAISSEQEANVHPQSNILMGCLGTEDDPPIDIHYIEQLRAGDALMACSDGVWHYFTDSELGSVLSSLSPREASEFLIDKARSRGRGGGDNLSLVIVKFEPLD
ncbi:MAG: protein phosphatase 2C domain-containing protein [Burkholderiaceae bacterium]|nr:protein phosphatase 2C domain-containing protein [Burkholderiaceae bacterium]